MLLIYKKNGLFASAVMREEGGTKLIKYPYLSGVKSEKSTLNAMAFNVLCKNDMILEAIGQTYIAMHWGAIITNST